MFADRRDAGRRLAQALRLLVLPRPVLLALPRGGVPLAAEIAPVLNAPLDLLLVRKIGAPWQSELAIAAVAEGAVAEPLVDAEMLRASGADADYLARQTREAWREIERQRALYGAARIDVEGASAIVVDDGIATGTTARAALRSLRRRRPARLVLAVPVAAADAAAQLAAEVDDFVCLATPRPFVAVGAHYADFDQLSDDAVLALLAATRR